MKNTLGHDWNCNNCCYFIPNGSPLGMGYCIANKYTYRKKDQGCEQFCPRSFIVMECIRQGWTPEQIVQEFGLRADLVAEEVERRTKEWKITRRNTKRLWKEQKSCTEQ